MPMEHAAQCTVVAKFGALDERAMQSFVAVVEDALLRHAPPDSSSSSSAATRGAGAGPQQSLPFPIYKQDEVGNKDRIYLWVYFFIHF
jgi:hypothetical protein